MACIQGSKKIPDALAQAHGGSGGYLSCFLPLLPLPLVCVHILYFQVNNGCK